MEQNFICNPVKNWKKMSSSRTIAKPADIRPLLFLGFLASLIFGLVVTTPAFAKAFNLATVKQQVLADYKNVSHMETAELATMLAEKKDLLIFDVREPDEYNVSHIPGAIRISPSTWGWSFLRQWGPMVKGKTVVFYCSVGVRSSIMAARVQDGLRKQGAIKTLNLNGGIFAWHNERRPIVNAKGETPYVHPFDKHWGSLLKRQSELRMSPMN